MKSQSELTELFRAREASCPKGKKMEQRRSLIIRDCKEELKFERKRKQTEAFACDRCGTSYCNTSVGCYRISHHSVENGDNIFAASKRIENSLYHHWNYADFIGSMAVV